jgi:hypothetical protein
MLAFGCNAGATPDRSRTGAAAGGQAARTAAQRRQWRESISGRLARRPWHFWQRASRIIT